jgi:hypothetical protein
MELALARRWPDRAALSVALRRRRFAEFRRLLEPLPRPLRLLDLGGRRAFWDAVGFPGGDAIEIVLLNRSAEPVSGPFTSLVGDARDLSRFSNAEFDVVFSNSVIEHVGGPEDQRRMADEVRRVGLRYFVQTPNVGFPIEPHFVFPAFQHLPLRLRVALVRRCALGFAPRLPDAAEAEAYVRSIRLLGAAELMQLFPSARLLRERFCGLTKSLVACGGF